MNLRYAIRTLARTPGATVVVVLTLALGIGANTAVFSIADAVFLRPLPYEDSGRIMMVWTTDPAGNRRIREIRPEFPADGHPVVSGAAYLDWRAQNRVFDEMAAYDIFTAPRARLTGADTTRELQSASATAGLLPLLRVAPALGRTFAEEEDRPGGPAVAVIGNALWRGVFGGDPEILGRAITLDGRPHVVIGVMPPGFDFPNGSEIWRPLAIGSRDGDFYRGQRNFRVLARLKRGVGREEAAGEIASIERQSDSAAASRRGVVKPLHEHLYGDMRLPAMVLLGAVGFLLLIACANVANVLLMRAGARRTELAIRACLGAGRERLMGQLMAEGAVLAAAGGGAGLLAGAWCTDLLAGLVPPGVPRADEIAIDGRVLAFTAAVSLVTALVVGLLPALQASRQDPGAAIKQGERSTGGGGRTRGAMVVVEVAMALVLLAGAGLMINTFVRLMMVERGFESEGRYAMQIRLTNQQYKDEARRARLVRELVEGARRLPGARAAAAVYPLPFSGGQSAIAVVPEGQPLPDPRSFRGTYANFRVITPEYFRAMGIRLIRGRVFSERDTAESPWVVIVNETMARRMWPGEDPIGKRFTILSGKRAPAEVVGVVADVKHTGLDMESGLEMYVPCDQRPNIITANLVIHASGDPRPLAAALRAQATSADPELVAGDLRAVEELVAGSLAPRRLYLVLLGLFGGLALALAAVGIYGVVSCAAVERTREVGIRMALGASPPAVRRLMLRQGMLPAALGVAAGTAGALALTRLLAGLLFGVKPADPATFAAAAAVLLVAALAAAWIPARRATRVDPVEALRYE